MDYFFQEQRWTDTFLSLHVKKFKRIILFLLIAFSAVGAKAQSDVKFNGDIRYSKWVIDSRMNNFYANTTKCGFAVYNQEGTQTSPRDDGKTKLDYVVGLVAKSIIEASQYYSQYTWAQSFAKPWFLSIKDYGDNFYSKFETNGGSLDDLNAVKLFIPLRELTATNGTYPNATTYANTKTALDNAITGLNAHNTNYRIKNENILAKTAGNDVLGGWWHKSDYQDQMWLDGSYMGPALFAQLVNYSNKTTNIDSSNDWNLIVNQFTILRNMCWNSDDKLLYHAFAADGGTNTTSHSDTWYGLNSTDNYCFHSASYWGRAVGWYFLALVDVLEQMEKANIASTDSKFTTLKGYLEEIAEGIKNHQDQTTGGWYQILDKGSDYSASSYDNGQQHTTTYNYIESSATALFTAAYLKAIRLKYLDETTYKSVAEDGYKCLVNNFFSVDENGKVNIFGSCRSAGLGGNGDDYKAGKLKYRNGSKEYYLLGYDVAKVEKTENKTEGKVMGAFIMAATEYEIANPKDIRFSYDLAPTYTLAQGESIKAEALGSGTISYQWCKSDDSPVTGATSETFTPAESGSYYCKATSGSTIIKTSETVVTVNAVSNDVITTGEAIATFADLTSSEPESWTATENKGFTVTGIPSTKKYSELEVYAVKMNYKSDTQDATTITLNVPEGYTVTSLIIKAINASTNNTTEITLNGVDKVTIDKVNNAYKEYEVILTNPVTGSGSSTISITNSGGKELGISQIKVLGYQGTPSSLSITTQPVGATYDYGVSEGNVTDLSVTAEKTGIDEEITYQWYSNTTNSNTNGKPIDGATSESYKPVVTTAGTTYYYCIASAGGKTATSDVVAVAVLNPSNLAINTQSNYKNNSNAWTPAVGGTISITDIVTSSSKGAYSITTGDAATLDGTSLTAVKDGTITLKQAADDNYKEGSIAITVRIGQDVTSNGSNAYSFTEATNVSDGMTIARKDITMTFGNDGFWKKPSENGYTQGQNNPVVTNNIPKRGTFYKFNATGTGSLSVKVRLGHDGNGKLRPLYVSENGTLVKAKKGDGTGTELDPTNMPEATASYEGFITFPVKANTDYYVYVPGSKLGFYGFTFTPLTLYTVTFNAGTNGTCSTTSLMQESAGATITLPEVTPKTGYKFDGWYTEGGDKVTSPYKPESSDITLYAHYISTVSTSVVATFENPTKTTWNEKNQNGFTINGVSNIKNGGVKLSSDGSITLTIPEGYTVTGFDFTLLCTNTTEGSTLSVGDDQISVKDGTHTLHNMNLSSSVTGSATLTITNSGAKELNIKSINVYGSHGKSISFTTHPQDAEYVTSATAKELTVVAKVNNVTETPTIKYQWFSNTTKSTDGGKEIEGATNTSYTPIISTAGTTYYYCKATVDAEALEAYSNIATVKVSDPTLTIVTQPVGATYAQGQSGVEPLMVEAKSNTGRTDFTYQWYKKTSETATASLISGATESEYTPPVDAEGTIYYYCEVKLTLTSEKSLTATTKTVSITVNNEQPIYGYKVSKAGLPAPGINTSMYITTNIDGTGDKLVKMTFGGWKWNDGKYTKPDSETQITDSWKDSETVSGVTVLDGYQYWFSGTQDAKQEDKDAPTQNYGETRYGWFESPTRVNGVTTDSHPYTLPVRGSFMTFEPTKNGTLTIYILQNGAWNTFDKDTQLDGVSYKKGAIKPGEFRMHAFQITNQRGLVLAEFAPKYSVTNNQKVQDGYTCTEYLTRPSSFDKTSTDVSKWEEFWTLSETERKAVHDNWSDAENNGCQKIIKLENGSFLAIQKAVVKYQFHVTGNETYYLFSNFSKMGFSGATFQPDAESGQPQDVTTFSGDNSLSDTKDYTEIAMKEDGTIGETGLTNYKYTINNVEVGKVDGVFIPQFKKITLKRTFKPNQWTTLSLPFNLTQTEVEQIFGEGTQIIVFDKANITPGKIYLTFFYHEIQNVLPGYPYLIRPTLVYANGNNNSNSVDYAPRYTITGDGDNITLTEFTVYNKAINPHIKPHEFKSGGYTAKCTPSYCTAHINVNNSKYSMQYEEGDIFVSEGNGTVYISEGNSYGKGYRSYIEKDKTGTTTTTAKALSISFSGVEDGDDNGTTTEIRVTELADDVIETLGIGGVYNLNGQKVADTTRNLPAGIYIVNGRKVVVK